MVSLKIWKVLKLSWLLWNWLPLGFSICLHNFFLWEKSECLLLYSAKWNILLIFVYFNFNFSLDMQTSVVWMNWICLQQLYVHVCVCVFMLQVHVFTFVVDKWKRLYQPWKSCSSAGSKPSYPIIFSCYCPNGTKFWSSSIPAHIIPNNSPWSELFMSSFYLLKMINHFLCHGHCYDMFGWSWFCYLSLTCII